ncbi:unnamed protein product [Arctogadus glacialis]
MLATMAATCSTQGCQIGRLSGLALSPPPDTEDMGYLAATPPRGDDVQGCPNTTLPLQALWAHAQGRCHGAGEENTAPLRWNRLGRTALRGPSDSSQTHPHARCYNTPPHVMEVVECKVMSYETRSALIGLSGQQC